MLTKLQEIKTEDDVRAVLRKIMQEDFLEKWMTSSVPYFDNDRPIDLIKNGKINRIKIMIHYLASGVNIDV